MNTGRLLRGPLVCIALLALNFATTKAADYEWGFTAGNLNPDIGSGLMTYAGTTASLTTFGTTDGTTVPHIGGNPATYMSFPRWGTPAANDISLGYKLTLSNTGPNGGGAYVNSYSVIFDVYIPGTLNWTPLFNSEPGNGNDADWYVAPDGSLGIGALGYSGLGLIAANTWYRVGFTADLGSGDVRYYINGSRVFTRTGASLLDGRFALYSNAHAGEDLLIANENDGSGNYTHAQIYSAIAFTDRTLSDVDFLAMGAVDADGILIPEPGSMALLGFGLAALIVLRRSAAGQRR